MKTLEEHVEDVRKERILWNEDRAFIRIFGTLRFLGERIEALENDKAAVKQAPAKKEKKEETPTP